MPEKLNAPTLHKRLHTRASTVRNGFFASEPANASSYLAGSRGLPLRNGSLTSWKKKKKKSPILVIFFDFWISDIDTPAQLLEHLSTAALSAGFVRNCRGTRGARAALRHRASAVSPNLSSRSPFSWSFCHTLLAHALSEFNVSSPHPSRFSDARTLTLAHGRTKSRN